MSLLVVIALALASYFVRQEMAKRNTQRDAVPGSPKVTHSRAGLDGYFTTPRARWLGRPKRGDAGTVESLIEARRFREASALVTPDDHVGRVRLAVRRRAPIVDLQLGARLNVFGAPRDLSPLRTDSQRVLVRLYAGTNWGFSVKAAKPTRAEAGEHEALALLSHGRLRTPVRIYGRLLAAYPNADDAAGWRLRLALLNALLGRTADARRFALAVADSEAPARLRQRGSALAHIVGTPERPIRPRKARKVHVRAVDIAVKSKTPWPATPHAVVELFAGRKATSERVLSRENLASALKSGAEVWVGHLRPDGSGHAVAIRAFAPTQGAVMLADGSLEEWGEFMRASVWGPRMLVVHRKGRAIPGDAPEHSYTELPCPRAEDGQFRTDPDALAEMKGAAGTDDPLASFIYAQALSRAVAMGAYGASILDVRKHLAITVATYPRATWPLAMLSSLSNEGIRDQARNLFAVGLEHWSGPSFASHEARAQSDPAHKWFHLREANAASISVSSLVESLLDAAQRGDGIDVDAHLELLQHILPAEDAELQRCQALREVVWRGPLDALAHLREGAAHSLRNDLFRAVACQSGSARAIDGAVQRDQGSSYSTDVRFAALCTALHSGDVETIIGSARDYARIEGFDGRSIWALTFAMPVLCAPGDDRLLDLAPLVANRAGTLLGRWLMDERRDLGLALLRQGAKAGADTSGATYELASALVRQAAVSEGDARREAIELALSTLDTKPGMRDLAPMWELLRIAAMRFEDPRAALDALAALPRLDRPFESFVLAAACAEAAGEEQLASRMRARAANPALLNAATAVARDLAVDAELALALAMADPALSAPARWAFYGAGGDLSELPMIPPPGSPPIPSGALWRLAEAGESELLLKASAQAYPADLLLDMRDGAPRVALFDLAGVNGEGLPVVREMLATSSHPAYLRAAHLASTRGIEMGLSHQELAARAPGLAGQRVTK